MKKVAIAFVLAAAAGSSNATITGVALGPGGTSGTRGTSLGSYTLSPVGSTGALFSDITSISTPIGTMGFSPAMNVRRIGSGWATWSGGYGGEVYYSNGATSSTMTLPGGTGAFSFYTEPNPFAVYTITATANDGTSVSQDVDGSAGAAGYGFYTDGGSSLTSITVSSGADFAYGEFHIAAGIPAPASASLLALGGLVASRRRR